MRYKTYDLYKAGYLVLLGYEIEKVEFKKGEHGYSAVIHFESVKKEDLEGYHIYDLQVNLHDYISSRLRVKRVIAKYRERNIYGDRDNFI